MDVCLLAARCCCSQITFQKKTEETIFLTCGGNGVVTYGKQRGFSKKKFFKKKNYRVQVKVVGRLVQKQQLGLIQKVTPGDTYGKSGSVRHVGQKQYIHIYIYGLV